MPLVMCMINTHIQKTHYDTSHLDQTFHEELEHKILQMLRKLNGYSGTRSKRIIQLMKYNSTPGADQISLLMI